MLKSIPQLIKTTVRYKILVLVLFPIVILLPIALILAIYWSNTFSYQQLLIKVNTDLSVSHDIFHRIRKDYLSDIERLAESYKFRTALDVDNGAEIRKLLLQLKKKSRFTFLKLLDLQGKWLYTSTENGNARSSAALLSAFQGQSKVGIEIYSAQDLKQISPTLAEQQVLALIPTPRARTTKRNFEDRAMMIRALYPIKDSTGKVIAILDSGVLLNANFKLVDSIRDLAYGAGSLIPGSIGTVTVFLDDVRISTNVPLRPGERALGTRVSDDVRSQVLDTGKVWIDRAFVVNDWYISAYEPILDMDNQRVGMLYAGFSEKPFKSALWQALLILIVLFVFLMSLSIWVAINGAKSIFKPLELISAVIDATREGKVKRVGKVNSEDELGKLSHEFDVMLDLLRERNQQIYDWADQLEVKVKERTSELQQKNHDLVRTIRVLRETRQQLVIAEKLAALGELTAGVAHEINNPTAVILGNLEIIIDEIGTKGKPVQQELNLVIEQVYRIKDIINNLLQYANPNQYSSLTPPSEVNINNVVEHTMPLVQHLCKHQQCNLSLQLKATIKVKINPKELQQVLVNIIMNAMHALEESGDNITISTSDWDNQGVIIRIKDNGPGIEKQQMGKIFNPFYSTKGQGKGSGLGLSVSYGIIRRYGGNIQVESERGKGSTFSIWLQKNAQLFEDDVAIAEQLQECVFLKD
ncbi:MAG: cache domain-containing protein [Pseudomonadota bacterium]